MRVFIGIALCVVGALLALTPLLTYEDEDKKIQSRIEAFWIHLDDQRQRAFKLEERLILRVARIASLLLDYLFGPELFSARVVAVTIGIAYTIISLLAFIGAALVWKSGGSGLNALIVPSVLITFAVIVMIFSRRPSASPKLLLLWIVVLGVVAFIELLRRSLNFQGIIIFLLATLLSIASDVAVLYILRRLLRSTQTDRSFFHIAMRVVLILSAAILIWIGPLVIAILLGADRLASMTLAALWVFNLADAIVLAAAFCLAFALLAHHFAWPAIQRPLYAMQRSSSMHYKAAAYTLGAGMLTLGFALTGHPITSISDLIQKLSAR